MDDVPGMGTMMGELLETERDRIAEDIIGNVELGFAVTPEALFDRDYQPIPGSNPEQVMTAFTEFTDRVLTPVQEAIVESNPSIVFCAAVDDNG